MKREPSMIAGMRLQIRAVFRDPGVLLLMVIAPLLYAFFYPLPYLGDRAEEVPIGIIDAEGGPFSRQLIRWMQASPRLEVCFVTRDSESAQIAYLHGKVRGLIWFPEGWESDFRRGLPVVFPSAGDGSSFLVAREGLLGMAETTGTLSAGIQIKRLEAEGYASTQAAVLRDPLRLEVLRPYNTKESYLNAVYLTVIVLILQQTSWLGMAMASATLRLRPEGELRGLRVGAGVFVVNASVCFAQAMLLTGPVFHFFHMPFPKDRLGALAFLGLMSVTLTLFGTLVSKLFRERESSPALWVGTSIPMLFMAGSIWPVESMHSCIVWLRSMFPSTPAIQGIMQFWVYGAEIGEVRGVWGPLWIQAAVAALLLLLLFRFHTRGRSRCGIKEK
jgi:ABC-2 type transport system permease protein